MFSKKSGFKSVTVHSARLWSEIKTTAIENPADWMRRDSIGHFSISVMQRLVLQQPLSSLNESRQRPVVRDGGGVANLAYWVTATEGSNPLRSANINGFCIEHRSLAS